jgi:hypothetical protein
MKAAPVYESGIRIFVAQYRVAYTRGLEREVLAITSLLVSLA